MNFSELSRIIDMLSKERSIDRSVVIRAVEHAFLVTAKKKYGIQGEYEAKYNTEIDEIEIFQYKTVVTEVKNNILEIDLESAKHLDPSIKVDDQLGIKIEKPNFTRMDVQTVRQIIFQQVRDAEREILFSEFKHREGELISGIVRRQERGNIVVDLGKADAILYRREVIPGENYTPGDRIQSYLTEVVMTHQGPEIRLSRTSPLFLVKLFETEVPEIVDGVIEIKSAAREPGQRAKLAVKSNDKEIDPVGACVGMKGARVQNIVNELQGEKIDIVRWHEDLDPFVREALKPTAIYDININTAYNSVDVIVEDTQLSLAIGRRGQNVRLAAMLTGLKINIISKTKLQEKIKKSFENLTQLSFLSDTSSQILIQSGIMNVGIFVATPATNIAEILSITPEVATSYVEQAKEMLEKGLVVPNPAEEEDIVSATADPVYKGAISTTDSRNQDKTDKDKFTEVEKRLREELAAFKLR